MPQPPRLWACTPYILRRDDLFHLKPTPPNHAVRPHYTIGRCLLAALLLNQAVLTAARLFLNHQVITLPKALLPHLSAHCFVADTPAS